MRADEHRVELDALRAERIQHELVRHVECRLRKARAAEAILVRDHRELEAGALRLAQGREHARHEADLLDGVDLFVGRLLDERAVAVDEQHAGLAHARLRIRRSFCSGVPTEMRNDCGDDAAHVADQQLRRARRAEHALRHPRNPPAGSSRRWAISSARPCRSQARRDSRSRSARTCATRSRWMASCAVAERGEHRLDGELRNGIGRDHLARAARRFRARRSASPRARRPGHRPSTACAAPRGSGSARAAS